MKKSSLVMIWLLAALLLSGCLRLATSPTVDLSRFTPQPEPTSLPSGDPAQSDATDEISPATQRVLDAYPLWLGSAWVYDYLGYDADREVVWRVVDTVLETRILAGRYAAKVERTIALREGEPEGGFPMAPQAGFFWSVIEDDRLYRAEVDPAQDLSNAWLELVFPFPENKGGWYPDPDLRNGQTPTSEGLRFASEPYEKVLPMGGVYICYRITTQHDDVKEAGTFCEGIGYVHKELVHIDQMLGFHVELVGFSLQ